MNKQTISLLSAAGGPSYVPSFRGHNLSTNLLTDYINLCVVIGVPLCTFNLPHNCVSTTFIY
jgi:hypothetical protein